ncbi:uncharacterized protein LOC116843555 [Odontomachus brunneus]|uniref:uncharacterized protein LOC116843555 n=1 Tax=Odontomachus brunneus TaxID=486640 RepID=UPI0013F1FD10|nr:uncharacterized protein LOC116843555 [Odontomachus brunneus]
MIRKNTINRTLKFMFILFGIWPGMSGVLLCRVFWVVSLVFVGYCHYHYFVTHIYTAELLDLMDCLCSFLAYIKVLIKFIMFWLNQQNFVEILSMMSDDWDECAKSDTEFREAECKAKTSDRIMNSIVVLHTMTIIAYCTGVILDDVDVTDHTTELPYVNKLDIPFDVNTQLVYRAVLIIEFLYMIMCGWAAGVTNALLLSLTLHAAGQIDILRNWFTQLVPHANENKHKSIDVTLNQIIKKHQKIIYFSESIESLYTHVAFLQFGSNMIMICSLGFLIVTAIGSPNAVEQIVRSLLFYTITNLEAFIFCFAGEYLSNKSKLIGIAAYNTAWYNMEPKDGRVLFFVIMRSQRQLTLTAGKMTDLSLETFASTLHVAGQMEILRKWFTQLISHTNEDKHESINVTLNQIIQKHQKIINFSKNINNLYTQIAFLQFASNTIMICSLGFLIVKAIGSPNVVEQIMRSILFYTITNLEAFIFCFAGEYLSNKSKLIGSAAYNTEWYKLKPTDCRILLFIILRSQKQLTLTAGKMTELSLKSFASTLHAAGQMEILRKWFTQLIPRANEDKHKSTNVTLNQIIQKHQKIINFSKNINNLYTQIAFLQFASNTLMICSLGFLIVKAIGSPNVVEQIMRSILFYTITNLEAFIFCFAGEYLSNKSKLIGSAAYNTEWYKLKPTDCRILLFIILRSQKQLTLTAGKMTELSLQSFASIMNASGSYLSVLLAMQ